MTDPLEPRAAGPAAPGLHLEPGALGTLSTQVTDVGPNTVAMNIETERIRAETQKFIATEPVRVAERIMYRLAAAGTAVLLLEALAWKLLGWGDPVGLALFSATTLLYAGTGGVSALRVLRK